VRALAARRCGGEQKQHRWQGTNPERLALAGRRLLDRFAPVISRLVDLHLFSCLLPHFSMQGAALTSPWADIVGIPVAIVEGQPTAP
jgi:hypothetical protein